jgi:hypothetical protein
VIDVEHPSLEMAFGIFELAPRSVELNRQGPEVVYHFDYTPRFAFIPVLVLGETSSHLASEKTRDMVKQGLIDEIIAHVITEYGVRIQNSS